MINPLLRPPAAPDRPLPPPLPEVLEKRRERRLATGFAALGIAVFFVAAILNPYDAQGRPLSHGTHRQLGLPPCAMKLLIGIPCPSCGMTTSVSLFMHGEVTAAWKANWAGVVVAALGMATTIWMLATAAGLPPRIFTVDETVKWLTVAGTLTAMARWIIQLLLFLKI